jgi:hypothetical protein
METASPLRWSTPALGHRARRSVEPPRPDTGLISAVSADDKRMADYRRSGRRIKEEVAVPTETSIRRTGTAGRQTLLSGVRKTPGQGRHHETDFGRRATKSTVRRRDACRTPRRVPGPRTVTRRSCVPI